jgi:hypothetical protein
MGPTRIKPFLNTSSHNKTAYLYVHEPTKTPDRIVPQFRHRPLCRIRLGSTVIRIVHNRFLRDIKPFRANMHLIHCPVTVFARPPLIVAENMAIRLVAAANFRRRLKVAFPPGVFGASQISPWRWSSDCRHRQQQDKNRKEPHGGASGSGDSDRDPAGAWPRR